MKIHTRNFQLIGNFNHLTLNKGDAATSLSVPLEPFCAIFNRNRHCSNSVFKTLIRSLEVLTQRRNKSDLGYILGWQLQANASLHALSAFTWNYQFYLGEGTCHMVLNDFCEDNAFPVSSPSPFYNEQSARGISFNEWLHTFATSRRFRENSAAYYH